jgi:hypothetical protein
MRYETGTHQRENAADFSFYSDKKIFLDATDGETFDAELYTEFI